MPPDVPTGVPRGVPTGSRNLSTLAVSLAIFGLACCLVLALTPRLFTGPERPGFAVFLVAGVAVVALTAVLFGFIDRLGMGFGRTVLVLAAGYNALIAGVKLGLAPAAMYVANSGQAFEASVMDPNGLWFYLGVGLGILLLYVLVYVVMYRVFRRRFRRRSKLRAARLDCRSTSCVSISRSCVMTYARVRVRTLPNWRVGHRNHHSSTRQIYE